MFTHGKANAGVWITIGSVLPAGVLIQSIYQGEAPSMIMAYVFSLVCVALEFTENFKPRIDESFPFFVLVFPVGLTLAAMDGGWFEAVTYAGIVLLAFFSFRYWFTSESKISPTHRNDDSIHEADKTDR